MSIINISNGKSDYIKKVSNDVFLINGNLFHLSSDLLRNCINSRNKVAHIWFFKINQNSYEYLLSCEEKGKANFYKRSVDRERYIFCRGLLKILLGYYLQLEPINIYINEGTNGKPEVSPSPRLSFNLSHSNEVVIYVFSNFKKVGVDVEYIHDEYNFDRMVMNLLSLSDFHKFESFSSDEKKMLFFKIWTAREACFKALGGKLSDYSINLNDKYDSMDFKVRFRGVKLSSAKNIHFKICDDYIVALTLQI